MRQILEEFGHAVIYIGMGIIISGILQSYLDSISSF